MLEVESGDTMRALRYSINIETGQVRTATFPNTINNRHIDKFGMVQLVLDTTLRTKYDFRLSNNK